MQFDFFLRLDKLGYFGNSLFQLMLKSRVVTTDVLNGGLYMLDLDESISFQTKTDNNMSLYVLYHITLCHT